MRSGPIAASAERDAVVVYRYDHFARSLRQLVNALSEFDALGIQCVSVHEGVGEHVPAMLAKAAEKQEEARGDHLLKQLLDLQTRTLALLAAATQAKSSRRAKGQRLTQ